MRLKLLGILLLLPAMLGLPAAAQDDGQPTIGLLRYSHSSGIELARRAFLDVMQAYGFISESERAVLNNGEDLDGEKINMFWGDAGGDLPTANLLVEKALDRGATLLATLSTPVSQIAVLVTNDMETPVPVVFSVVGAPYTAGIAEAPCVKPAHVAGTTAYLPVNRTVPLLRMQNPEATTIGMLANAGDAISVRNAKLITAAAMENGLMVETVAISAAPDLPIGVSSLIDKGIDAIYITGYVDTVGLPVVVAGAMELGLPVVALSPGSTRFGAPIGAGFDEFYREGVIQGRIIANYLNGDVDLSKLAISEVEGLTVALHLDVAAEYDFVFSDDLLARADYVIEDGKSTRDPTPPSLPDLSQEAMREADLEFLAGLECTPEMIAEQQAELDAANA